MCRQVSTCCSAILLFQQSLPAVFICDQHAVVMMQVYMSANAWNEVKYPRVASVCMKNNKGHFEKHDEERFTKYLQDVKAGKKKIASGALKPHELVSEAMRHVG